MFHLPAWPNKVQMGSMEAIHMAPVPIIIKIKFFLMKLMADKYTKESLECRHSSKNK